MRGTSCVALTLVLGVLAPNRHAAAPWLRLRAAGLVIIGDASERDLRQVAHRIATVGHALRAVLPRTPSATPVPTTVVVSRGDQALTSFVPLFDGRPRRAMTGYFQSGDDRS